MKYVLVSVESGYVKDVEFFDDPGQAVLALARLSKEMNMEKEDAAVYSPKGLIADADLILKWREHNQIDSKTGFSEGPLD